MKIREWTGCCQRCYKKTDMHIMSMYSTALICLECKDQETQRSDYKEAVDADHAAIKVGNFSFEGISEK